MSVLPVPAEMYFSDFAFDLVKYDVVRDGTHIATAKGLTNSDKTGNFISFPIDVDLQVGDVLQTSRSSTLITEHILRHLQVECVTETRKLV